MVGRLEPPRAHAVRPYRSVLRPPPWHAEHEQPLGADRIGLLSRILV